MEINARHRQAIYAIGHYLQVNPEKALKEVTHVKVGSIERTFEFDTASSGTQREQLIVDGEKSIRVPKIQLLSLRRGRLSLRLQLGIFQPKRCLSQHLLFFVHAAVIL